MKRIAIIVLAVLIGPWLYSQEETASSIERVQVYLQGAEVKRKASVNLKSGKNEIKFTKLSASLDPNTIQVNGTGFTILSVRHEKDFIENPNQPAEVKLLLEQKQKLDDTLAHVGLQLNILDKELELLNNNNRVVGNQGINNADFQQAVAFFSKRYKEINESQFGLKRKQKSLRDAKADIDKQLKSLSAIEKKPSSNIIVVLNSDRSYLADLTLNYAIKEAGWFPAYDLRATDTQSPLAISYKARVYQNSGVDWENVKLSISSANLEASGTVPSLNPYYLGRGQYYSPKSVEGRVMGVVTGTDDGHPLPQVTVLVKGTTIGTPTDANGRYSLQVPDGQQTLVFRYLGYTTQEIPINQPVINVSLRPDTQSLGEVVVTTYDDSRGQRNAKQEVMIRGYSSFDGIYGNSVPLRYEQIDYQTSFVYDIDLPYSIPSTGQPEVVDIKTEALDVTYEYFAAPKARESAYLTARIPGWEKLDLLAGESNLYFENSFVGRSLIDPGVGLDTLSISLGKDEGIIVNRERKRDFEQQRVLSGKKREERHFEITVVNTKKQAIQLKLNDQVPVTVKDNIKVEVLDTSGARLNEETGLLTWNLVLQPGEKKTLNLSYLVAYPKNERLVIN